VKTNRPNQIGVRELARLARVSIGTVDRALNGRPEVSEKTRERILRLAEEYGYRPNLNARALSTGKAGIKIGVCIPREIHFFYDELRDGILEEGARHSCLGIDLNYEPLKALGSDELSAVARIIRTDIQALIITPGNSAELAPLIDEAEQERNIRVICVASDDSLSNRSTAVCVEPRMNGMLAGELLAGFVPACSRVAVFTGMLTTEDHARKVSGFYEGFLPASSGGRVVEVLEGHEDEAETFEKCINLLRSEPDLAGLYVSTVNSLPVCRALQQMGLAGKVRLIGTDLFAELLPWFHNRTISALVHQRPYRQGQLATRLIADHFLNGIALPPVRHLNPAVVMRSNLMLFRETLRSKPRGLRRISDFSSPDIQVGGST
jgi:LacI family transcriptional regulator